MEPITPIVKVSSRLSIYVCSKGNGAIKTAGAEADAAERQADDRNKWAIFKNCAPFSDSVSEMNNSQIDNAKDVNVVMLMYNLMKLFKILQRWVNWYHKRFWIIQI